MQNSMVVFTFSLLDRKHLFWGNLIPKIKIDFLKWKLVPRINSNIIELNGDVHFLFRMKIPSSGKFGPKNQNFQSKLKFGT